MSARLDATPRLREMSLHDLAAVLAVEGRAYSHPWTRGNFVDSLAAGYYARVLAPRHGPLLGYCVAMTGVDELHLLNVTVDPAVQGRGHGSALLRAVQAHGRQSGLRHLWLEVRPSNARARSLYLKRGFVEVGRRRGYYPAVGGREDAVVMRLALDPADTSARSHDEDGVD